MGKKDALFLAIIFHDIVYNPKSSTNEEDSAQFFIDYCKQHGDFIRPDELMQQHVVKMILETKNHKPTTEDSQNLCNWDMEILHNTNFDELLDYEHKIFKEYQHASWEEYRDTRYKFLSAYAAKHTLLDLMSLANYVKYRTPKIGIYAGSFNPFHIGHQNILEKAEKIFDKVIIARGINADKKGDYRDYRAPISTYREYTEYDGLLTDYIQNLPPTADYTLIRGLRNGADLQYEMNQYRFLQDLQPDIKVVQILCDREYEHVSSSAIRSLATFGIKQTNKYLPNNL